MKLDAQTIIWVLSVLDECKKELREVGHISLTFPLNVTMRIMSEVAETDTAAYRAVLAEREKDK